MEEERWLCWGDDCQNLLFSRMLVRTQNQTHTEGNAHPLDQITQWSRYTICHCTGNGIHLSNLPGCSNKHTDIAVFVI